MLQIRTCMRPGWRADSVLEIEQNYGTTETRFDVGCGVDDRAGGLLFVLFSTLLQLSAV